MHEILCTLSDSPSENTYPTSSAVYRDYCKPKLQNYLSLLKLDATYVRAKKEFLYLYEEGNEVEIVDMLGGFGSTILGHNHPEIKAQLKKFLDQDGPIQAQVSIRSSSAQLGKKLNEVLQQGIPVSEQRRYLSHFLSTGTEAVEAALKHALMKWNERRELTSITLERNLARTSGLKLDPLLNPIANISPVFIAIEGSFHGKTAGSLSITSNPYYSSMYSSRSVSTVFVSRNANAQEVQKIFDDCRIQLPSGYSLSRIAGVILEPVQGEGGVQVLPTSLINQLYEQCKKDRVPLIADEIQSGLFRTGKWLAFQNGMNTLPDYILLGKSFGGGIAKIAAVLISEDHYCPDFALKHSSTFAEDDFSSVAALKTLEILNTDQHLLKENAGSFEKHIKEAVELLMERYPGVIQCVRGRGFMMGIEFNFKNEERLPHVLDSLIQSGYIIYIFASYLLNVHQVRTGTTLNETHTLRLEPSAYISPHSVQKTLCALEALVRLIYENKILELTAHLLNTDEIKTDSIGALSPVPNYRKQGILRSSRDQKHVSFIIHLVNPEFLKKVDPYFLCLNPRQREKFANDFGPMGESIILHRQLIRGKNGKEVLFDLRAISSDSLYFEKALRKGTPDALYKVRSAVSEAERGGATHIGLGQYTSIVTENGLLIRPQSSLLTTGNSLTVAIAWETLKKILELRGQNLSKAHIGIVGVAGNICNLYAQIAGDWANQMTVVHHTTLQDSPKFRSAVQQVLLNSSISRERLHIHHELQSLSACDIVILGTNSTKQFIMSEHLKTHAIVLDISVPSNLHPSVLRLRPDIEYVQGGYAKLPLGQVIDCPPLFPPPGETFACLAETLTIGLTDFPTNYSMGVLKKDQILQIKEMAFEVGFEVGEAKRSSVIA